jgi:hypothetical protein
MIDTLWSSPYISGAAPESFFRRPCGRCGHVTATGCDASRLRRVRRAYVIYHGHHDEVGRCVEALHRLRPRDPDVARNGRWQ